MAVTIEPAQPADFPALAREGDQVVGIAGLEIYGTTALLRSVAVMTTWQGQGLGQQLATAALDLARAHGVREVYLLTETAPDFFPRLGFAPVARDAVAPAIQQSVEWTSACPVSAQAMVRHLESVPTPAAIQGVARG
jgi:amino-acid N-acetyltransferase